MMSQLGMPLMIWVVPGFPHSTSPAVLVGWCKYLFCCCTNLSASCCFVPMLLLSLLVKKKITHPSLKTWLLWIVLHMQKGYFFYIVEIIGFMCTKHVLLSSNPNPCLLIFVLRESKWPHLYLNRLCTPGKLSNCVLSALPFQLGKFKTVLFCSKIFNHSWLPILKSSIISTNIHELLNTNFSCYQI